MTTEPASSPGLDEGEPAAPRPTPEFDERQFLDATAEAKSRYGRFNLAVIGGTGVGKSSLVNAVFVETSHRWARGCPSPAELTIITTTRSASGISRASSSARKPLLR